MASKVTKEQWIWDNAWEEEEEEEEEETGGGVVEQ